MPKRILFIYNQVSEGEKKGFFGECILERQVKSIREALLESNNHVLSLDLYSPSQLEEYIRANQPIDLAFVIAEGFKADPQTLYNGHGAALIRKYLRKHNIYSTHSSFDSMEICRNKNITYTKLAEKGIPIPKHVVVSTDLVENNLLLEKEVLEIGYPVIIKPSGGGNSIGITANSVVYDFMELRKQISVVQKELGHTILLIEKYLCGQEYTIGILGNSTKYVLPIIGFPKNLGVRDAATKKIEHSLWDSFETINADDNRFEHIVKLGIDTFDAVCANDVLRIDLKEDQWGDLYVIDVNGTPSLGSRGSLSFMAQGLGLKHNHLVQFVLYESMKRCGLLPNHYFNELIMELKERFSYGDSIEVA